MNTKSQLALGVASTALVIGLAAPAQAACTVDSTTVACTADNTAAEVNAAMASVAGNDVTLQIVTDANVVQPSANIQPAQQGAVAISNAGTVGTEAAPVGVFYSGSSTDAANIFSLDNSGVVTGQINISDVGGTIDIDNSGSINGGVVASAMGAVTLNSSGNIDSAGSQAVFLASRTSVDAVIDGDVGTAATATTDSNLRDIFVASLSFVSDPTTSETETVGAVTTTTTTSGFSRAGGTGSAEVGEGANTGSVTVNALDGAEITIDGTVGSETEYKSVFASSNGTDGKTTTVSTTDGTDSSFTQTNTNTALGGTASVSVSETGSVSGDVNADGLEGANIIVDGAVGTENFLGSAFASSSGTNSRNTNFSSNTGALSVSGFESTNQSVGGEASVTVGETGSVAGFVSASGFSGAQIAIDGAVGLPTNATQVNAISSGSSSSFEQQSTFDGVTGASTFSQQSTNASTGGAASIVIGETGIVNATVDAFANMDATVSNAGQISGSVSARSSGSESSSGSENEFDGISSSSSSSFSQNTGTGGNALIENAAGGLIGLDATAPISVLAVGNTSATVANAGRINGSVNVSSSTLAFDNQSSNFSTSSTDMASGTVTSVNESSNSNSNTNIGGDATFANAAGGLVTGSVNVSGTGNASVTNEGAVIGTTNASSQATDSTSATTDVNTSVFVPGPDGGATNTREFTQETSNLSSGGDVTGTYAGTNGAVQFAPPFSNGSDGSVSQFANGDSSALVSGAIFGSFTGEAFGEEFSSTFTDTQVSTFDSDSDQQSFDRDYVSEQSNNRTASDSSLAVAGGRIEGTASLLATGSASAQIGNGGLIAGNLNATARGFGGSNRSETYGLSQSFDEDGVFTGSELVQEISLQNFVNTGNVTVAIGDGTVEGSVSMNGAGGINDFSLSEDGVIGGGVFQNSQYSALAFEQTFSSSSTATDTVSMDNYAETRTASGGDITSSVAGTIGNGDVGPQAYGDVTSAGGTSLSLRTDAGNADAIVNGQVRNGIQVLASGSDTTFAQQQTRENGSLTASASQNSSTATGGTASLTVDAGNADTPANFGSITVAGRSGSTVAIGAGSSVLASTNGASMRVGGYFFDTTSTLEDEYTGTDLTGRTTTSSSTIVGGTSSLTNDGRIGYDGGAAFDGDNAFVSVISPSMADATNNGQIFGSIAVSSLYEDTTSTTTSTDLNDVTRVDTTTTTYAANGGAAILTNNGLVTGNASIAALDGTVVNNGVLRGNLSLGGNVDNYTTQSVDTLTQFGEAEVLDLADAIEQGYAVAQNGLLGGTISVAGAFGNIDREIRTSSILGDINLNSGSVTGGGVVAEYDDETGERFTQTNVNLNGSGYLGLGDTAIAALEDAFGDTDPRIAAEGDLSAYSGGARVLGVETLTKTGDGVFLITGANFAPTSNTNVLADYTLDLGTFAINGGEIQLATAGAEGVFGVRGDIANSAGLVLGSRVELPAPLFGTNASVTAIDGVEVYQNGDFSQSGSGTLSVGVTPTLVRVTDPAFSNISTSTNPLAVQSIGLGSGLFTTPENAFGQAFTDLGTSFLTVDGDMDLAGTVALVSPTGGIFTDGQTVDIASVSGTLTTSANVDVNSASNFVSFDLATRTEGGRTILFASADRAGFETAGTNKNAIAAGTALSQAFPDVIATIQAGSAGGIGLGGDRFVLAQDLANLFVGMDTLLTMDQAATALNELASGEFYGSLTTLETTAPFVDAISARRVPEGASGFNLWLAPSGDFVDIEGDAAVGSRDIKADNYGASGGFGIATGNGEIGLGFGYGRISADTQGDLLTAQADTWMVGAYVRQSFGNFSVGADLIYGWSDWNATRVMPTLSRTALGEFDSTELRGDLRAEYMVDFGGGWVAPFGELSFRKFDFDGFTEQGAGAVNLVVAEADDTVFTPTLGLRAGTSFETGLATLRPQITLAYSFDDDNSSFRDVAYLGAPTNSFRLQGVDPDGYFTIGAGLFADIGANSGAFVRGSYATGGGFDGASVNAGVTIGF